MSIELTKAPGGHDVAFLQQWWASAVVSAGPARADRGKQLTPVRVLSMAHVEGGDAAERIARAVPGVQVIQVSPDGPMPAGSEGAEVLIAHSRPTPNLERALAIPPRWVHLIGTGIEHFPLHLAHPGTVVTCSRGASAVPISEWTLTMMLAFEKRLPESWIDEPPERRTVAELGILQGRTLGLIGLGGIGSRIARLARAFEMRVLAVRRSDQPSPLPGVELVRSLDEMLPQVDHPVVAAPATAATRHIVGGRALATVKPGVHLVNISRGWLVDQEALREALDDGRVARASLDTVEPEPLPGGHWLYTHPRVKLSAHVSWMKPGVYEQILDPAIANLRRYLAGQPLEGVVDRGEGY